MEIILGIFAVIGVLSTLIIVIVAITSSDNNVRPPCVDCFLRPSCIDHYREIEFLVREVRTLNMELEKNARREYEKRFQDPLRK